MTYVDLNRQKGNYAQAIVSEWLSRSCLVRLVSEGTDIGVDLYCESLVNGTPHLHFWVQVKAVGRKHVSAKKGSASYSFDKKHMQYWGRQPVPVYAFLVPVFDWPPKTPDKIYGIRITEYVVRNGVPNGIPDRKRIPIATTECFEFENLDRDMKMFLTEIVPWDASALLLKKGIVAPIDYLDKDVQQRFLGNIGYRYLEKCLETIRNISVYGLVHTLKLERDHPEWRQTRKQFENITSLFEDNLSIHGLSALVRAAHADGDIPKAKIVIYRAITQTELDSSLSEQEKSERLQKFEILLKDFE